MPKETLSVRVTRLEELHSDLAEKVSILLDAQIKTEQQLREANLETDRRIGELVSAIGAFIREMRNGKSDPPPDASPA